MRGIWLLSFRHLIHARTQALILVACLTIVVFLPAASQRLITRYSTQLSARADATPMLLGTRGNRFDLTLQSLYLDPLRRRIKANNGSVYGDGKPLMLLIALLQKSVKK